MQAVTAIVSGRSCGTCTLCCRLPEIEEFSKPANDWCRHCVAEKGCRIYDDRPQLCRDFLCRYMTDATMPEAWAPEQSHMMVYGQGPQLTVLVDPDHADIWQAAPYRDDLSRWAGEAEADGGYVILYAGDAVKRIRP